MTGSAIEGNTESGHEIEEDRVGVAFHGVVGSHFWEKGMKLTDLVDDHGKVKCVNSSCVCGLDGRHERRRVWGVWGEDLDGLSV